MNDQRDSRFPRTVSITIAGAGATTGAGAVAVAGRLLKMEATEPQRKITVLGQVRQLVTPVREENRNFRLPRPSVRISDIFAAYYGDPSGAEYWADWLDYGENEHLARLLAAHLAAEANEGDDDSGKLGEEAAEKVRVNRYGAKLELAKKLFKELLTEFPQGSFRERVKAIAAHRERAHMLPVSLRNFLAQEAARAAAASREEPTLEQAPQAVPVPAAAPSSEAAAGSTPKSRRPGPLPIQKERVEGPMREMCASGQRDQLKDMTWKKMVAKFGAGRTTCCEAKVKVLKEYPELPQLETPGNSGRKII